MQPQISCSVGLLTVLPPGGHGLMTMSCQTLQTSYRVTTKWQKDKYIVQINHGSTTQFFNHFPMDLLIFPQLWHGDRFVQKSIKPMISFSLHMYIGGRLRWNQMVWGHGFYVNLMRYDLNRCNKQTKIGSHNKACMKLNRVLLKWCAEEFLNFQVNICLSTVLLHLSKSWWRRQESWETQ